MRRLTAMLVVVMLAGVHTAGQSANPQKPTPVAKVDTSGQPATIEAAVDRIIAQEQAETALIRKQTPIVQTYVQEVKLDKDAGTIPTRDHYYLGQARLDKNIVDNSMLPAFDGLPMKGYLGGTFAAPGFLQMIFVDTHPEKFNKQNYRFEFVGREFLGEVRCVVFDVLPLPKTGNGRFRGRIWAEDQDYTIVRFNGAYTPLDDKAVKMKFNSHFDSWRANVQPGIWLPYQIYMQELNQRFILGSHERFKAMTNFWGYKLSAAHKQEEFASMTIEMANAADESSEIVDNSAVQSKRLWDSQAEQNVTEGMERAGILTPYGPVDRDLDTLVNNLEVTNDLNTHFHCRVATFSTFEEFTIGNMIVLSRGLLDVLPDEATIAALVAQGIADGMNPNPLGDQYAFSDFARVSPIEALRRYTFKEKPEDIKAANDKAVQLLMNSPYKDKLGSAALFLAQLKQESKALTALISPRLGNGVYLSSELSKMSSEKLDTKRLDQVAALPVGGRIKMNPYDDSIELMKTKPTPLFSSKEKMPFEVTPIVPYLTRYRPPAQADAPQTSASIPTDQSKSTTQAQ